MNTVHLLAGMRTETVKKIKFTSNFSLAMITFFNEIYATDSRKLSFANFMDDITLSFFFASKQKKKLQSQHFSTGGYAQFHFPSAIETLVFM